MSIAVNLCERVIESEQLCTMCGQGFLPRKLQSHMAHHMQQLALFSLPKTAVESNSDDQSVQAPDDDSDKSSIFSSISAPGVFTDIVDDDYQTPDVIPNMSDENWRFIRAEEPLVDDVGVDSQYNITGDPATATESNDDMTLDSLSSDTSLGDGDARFGITEQECFNRLQKFLNREKGGLRVFYTDDALLKFAFAAKIMVGRLLHLGCGKETALQLSILVMYDVVMLIGLIPRS